MRTSIIIIIFLWLLCTAFNCENKNCHKHIGLINNTNIDIYIKEGSSDSSRFASEFPNPITDDTYRVVPHTKNTTGLMRRSCHESNIKTFISIYIFDANVLATFSWGTIEKNYMVLQRYDLTKEDLQRLNWELTYPPNEAMKDVKMYPPY
jgi:hypothetical protein